MAIPSYATSLIVTSGGSADTFGSWVTKTNTLFGDMATKVVTAEASSSGASTTGNTNIIGILGSTTLVAGTALRGGSISTPGTLNITSSTAMTPATASTFTTNAATSVTMSGDVSFNGAAKAFAVTTATTTIGGTTANLSSTTVNVTGTTANLSSTTTNVSGTVNLTGTTNITSAVITSANIAGLTATGAIHFDNTSGVELSTGTTAQRPTATAGTIRYNTSLGTFEGADGSAEWARLNGAYVSASAPAAESAGSLWFDTTNGALKVRNGSSWTQTHSITADASKVYLTKNFDMTGNLVVTGTIYASGDITALSDERVKENVTTITGSLDKVCSMRGVYYNMIGETERKVGVIAQEVERIIPELVVDHEDGYKSVAYANALGLIIEAIKELKADIETLKRG